MIQKIKIKIFNYFFQNFYLKKQLSCNENVLKSYNLDKNKIKKILNQNSLSYSSENLSWHHHIFAGFSNKKKINILEIGTYDGSFANYLSKIFPNSSVYTCDLSQKNSFFKKTYNRENNNFLYLFLNKRKKNILNKNIKFIEMDSFDLIDKFSNKKFDFIWVDGNHLAPQVQFDIFQSIKLIKKGGYFFVDDIIKKDFSHKYGSTESYQTLEFLFKMRNIKTSYLYKRLWHKNLYQEKFISITKV